MKGIFFDTNILFYSEKFFTKNDFDNLRKAGYKLLTSDIVVNEGKDKNYRIIYDKYEKLIKVVNDDKTNLYFKTKDLIKVDLEKTYNESNQYIDNFLKNDFCGEIINLNSKETALDVLFERYHFKIPPFSTGAKDSDKGWKDTLIWTSLIDFAIKSDLDEFIFFSNDSMFKDFAEILKEEFLGKTKKHIEFLNANSKHEFFQEIGLEKKEEQIKSKEMTEDEIKNIKKAIYDLTVLKTTDGFGNQIEIGTFKFKNKITEEQCEQFCDTLEKKEEDYFFEDHIDISPILRNILGYCEVVAVFFYSEIQNFVKAWKDIKEKYPNKKTAFLIALKDEFNKMVTAYETDELPF